MDNVSREKRSRIMSSIRARSRLETEVCKALWKRGLRFRTNVKDLLGKPDIAIKKYKIVVFIDSCFWHCCPIHGNIPKSNREYWESKLEQNKARDVEVINYYIYNNWNILRVWEHQIRKDFTGAVDAIYNFIHQAKKESTKKTKQRIKVEILDALSKFGKLITDIAFTLYSMSPLHSISKVFFDYLHSPTFNFPCESIFV